jgi:hypothetical protein
MKTLIRIAAGIFFMYPLSVFAQFGSFASAIHLSKDGGATKDFYNTNKLVGDANAIGPYNFTGDLGSFAQNGHKLLITGGEVKTFRGNNDNVCSAKLYFRIYPAGSPGGAFTSISLPFFANCSGGVFTDGKGPCSPTDQKWQSVSQNIDFTGLPEGSWVLDLYYEIKGKVNSSTGCDETVYDSNNSNNYSATFTIGPALPVKLIDFNASNRQGKVMLNWSSTNEENFSKFVVERSTDGSSFVEIGTVRGKGNPASRNNYVFEDAKAQGKINYYRLNQVDVDGRSSYSSIVKVNTLVTSSVSLQPNPAKDRITLQGINTGAKISIADITGRTLAKYTATSSAFSVPVQSFTAGRYFVTISDASGTSSLPFVKE